MAEQPTTPRRVRLPVFVSDEPVGLGDVIKRATSAIGVPPCGGCAERAARLNARVTFESRPSRPHHRRPRS